MHAVSRPCFSTMYLDEEINMAQFYSKLSVGFHISSFIHFLIILNAEVVIPFSNPLNFGNLVLI